MALRPARWSAGIAQTFVPVRSLAAIARARPDPARFDATFATGGRAIAYLYCGEVAETGHDFHARMFAPGLGVPKIRRPARPRPPSPGCWRRSGRYADGEHTVRIEQGYEMGRPSLIELTLDDRAAASSRRRPSAAAPSS